MTEHMHDELRRLAEAVGALSVQSGNAGKREVIRDDLLQLADRFQSESADNMREIIAAAELRGYRRAQAEVAERADHSEQVDWRQSLHQKGRELLEAEVAALSPQPRPSTGAAKP